MNHSSFDGAALRLSRPAGELEVVFYQSDAISDNIKTTDALKKKAGYIIIE
jgi:hypothetical protein